MNMNTISQLINEPIDDPPPLHGWSSGYSVEGLHCGFAKANQDAHVIVENLLLDAEMMPVSLHLVADGHGPYGNLVSKFIADKFPNILHRILSEEYSKILDQKSQDPNALVTSILPPV
jgi:serine/threonine protein phosphatase PrpC